MAVVAVWYFGLVTQRDAVMDFDANVSAEWQGTMKVAK